MRFTSIIALFLAFSAISEPLKIQKLYCEYRNNPIGIDIQKPRLSWELGSSERAQAQTAYRIVVASSEELLNKDKGDMWDSGKKTLSQSLNIPYEGKPLVSNQKVYWKLKVWDKNNIESAWSSVAMWSAGIMNSADWKARWIGMDKPMSNDTLEGEAPKINARYLHKKFELPKSIKTAIVNISGLGLYELYINGKKVGNDVLAPAQTQFDKQVMYNSYDVTNYLQKGKNAIGCILGNGRWINLRNKPEFAEVDSLPKFPKLIAQIQITFTDGSIQNIISDESWKISADGPVRFNNEFDGERYDANREFVNWATPELNDANWANASLSEIPKGKLSAQMSEPIRITEVIKPISIKKLKEDIYIMDMGQNMVGWLKLRLKGTKGKTVKLRFAETLKADGALYTENLRSAKATDIYISKGATTEEYEPRFTYHGFRFVEISGLGYEPQLSDFEGKVVHDDVEMIGFFECENKTMNTVFKNACWGIRGNYRSFPTDCPQRDERQGWLGDRGASSKGEAFVFRNINLYAKWLQDIKNAQLENGVIPDVAPAYYKIYSDNITWPSAYMIIPYTYYQNFGDKSVIVNNYEAMKKWSEHMISLLNGNLIGKDAYGDWCVPPENLEMIWTNDPKRKTSPMLLGSAYLYYDLKLMSFYSEIAERPGDKAYFDNKASEIKEAINKVLFDRKTAKYENNSMTSSILPLAFEIVPEEYKEKVFQNLVEKLIVDHNGHVGTGLIGAQWQMQTLSRFGRADLAYILASKTTYPSWGYMAEKGATTIWELWNGDKANPAMNSGNHVMLLGDLLTWMFENVGGISSSIDNPGFGTIVCKPDLIPGLSFATASHKSMYGVVASSWKIENGKYMWNLTVPVNTSAIVYVPAANENSVTESGTSASKAQGVEFIKMESGRAVYRVSSGTYSFVSNNFNMPAVKSFVLTPVIFPKDTSVASTTPIVAKIVSPTEGASVYYTTDGTEPNQKSKLYTGPIKISSSTTVKAKAFKDGSAESPFSSSMIDFFNPKINGWKYDYYEVDDLKALPNFAALKPLKSGTTSDLNLASLEHRADNFAYIFKSNISISEKANYTFYLSSDDGSGLYIDGKMVIDNDKIHGVETKSGSIALDKGLHTIEIKYFEGGWGELLRLEWNKENSPKTPVPVSRLIIK